MKIKNGILWQHGKPTEFSGKDAEIILRTAECVDIPMNKLNPKEVLDFVNNLRK
jgi:hypothetical protein